MEAPSPLRPASPSPPVPSSHRAAGTTGTRAPRPPPPPRPGSRSRTAAAGGGRRGREPGGRGEGRGPAGGLRPRLARRPPARRPPRPPALPRRPRRPRRSSPPLPPAPPPLRASAAAAAAAAGGSRLRVATAAGRPLPRAGARRRDVGLCGRKAFRHLLGPGAGGGGVLRPEVGSRRVEGGGPGSGQGARVCAPDARGCAAA